MINKIKVKNFKAFKNEQSIRIAPITLIYGPNSAGKSSVIQSLQLLNQSFLNADALKNNELAAKGASLDLGLPLNFMHRGNTKSPIILSFCDDLYVTNKIDNAKQKTGQPKDKIVADISLEFKQDDPTDKYSPLKLQSVNYSLSKSNNESFSFKFIRVPDQPGEYKLANNNSVKSAVKFFSKYGNDKIDLKKGAKTIEFVESKIEVAESELIKKFSTLTFSNRAMFFDHYFFPTYLSRMESSKKEANSFEYSFGWNRLMSDLNASIERSVRAFNHISGLRNSPQRYYPLTNTRGFVGRAGENMASLLLKLSKGANKNTFNKWLKNLDIPYQIAVEPINDSLAGSLLIIKLKDLRNNVEVTPSDVGIGISQILPLLVQGLSEVATEERGTRFNASNIKCVEQPELHLHPKLQANIADFFIETVTQNKSLRWILETHSESLLLRLQKRIRAKKIDPSLLSIVYVNPTKNGCSEVLELRLDEDGDFIDEWPNGFFEEAYKEKFSD